MPHLVHAFLILAFMLLAPNLAPAATDQQAVLPWTAEKAVDYALRHNPDSRMAQIRLNAARARMSQAESRLYPRLQLNGEYGQTDTPLYSFGNILNQGAFDTSIDFNDPGRTDNLQVQAEIRYRLYSGGSDQAAVALAEHDFNRHMADHAAIVNLLAFEVVRAFHHILLAEEMVEARRAALEAIGNSRRIAEARNRAGDLLRQQLLDLEVQEARAVEDLIAAQHTLALTHHAFNNLLGLAEAPVRIHAEDMKGQQLPQDLDYSARPELAAVERAIGAAREDLAMARADYRPTVDGVAAYQYDRGFVTGGDGGSWMAGVRLGYSLYDGGLRQANVAEKLARVVELEEQKRKTELQLNYELQQGRQELQQAAQRVAVTAKMVSLAEESARLSRARFQEGMILSAELIDVETRLTDVLVRDSQARIQQRVAIANLRRIAGLPQFPTEH